MIKNAGPLRLGAGRLCGLLADGPGGVGAAGSCLPFWAPEMQGGRGRAAGVGGAGGGGQGSGVMVFRGWLGLAMIRRQFGGI